jgi:hypothetical protein
MPGSGAHNLEYPLDVFQRHLLMEKITRRVDKDRLWILPSERQIECLGVQR